MSDARPLTLLIAALGGEGGGVLTDWIVAAAMAEDLPVQSTSIPGVAQRTGATTYYIEIVPKPSTDPENRPVMALYPAPAGIDVMVCSEILEAGRAMESGFVSPERTTLIASTHRVYAIAEKMAMADGRYDTDRIVAAAAELAKQPILADFAALARQQGTVINAVLLGAIAGAGVLPIPTARLEEAIRAGGKAVESNLKGFAAGLELTKAKSSEPEASTAPGGPSLPKRLASRIDATYPPELRPLVGHGVARLIDYQGTRYAARYLDRLDGVFLSDDSAKGFALTSLVARHLALWMAYEDVIRVAELKTRRERFARIRAETGAKPDEPVRITEFLKPGREEIAAILPAPWGRRLRAKGPGKPRSMRVRTDRLGGFFRMWLLARLRPLRPTTLRFREEQPAIDDWLNAIIAAAGLDYEFGCKVAGLAKALKGYGDTHTRGRRNYTEIMERLVRPALAGNGPRGTSAEKVARALDAALSDPEGFALERALAADSPPRVQSAASADTVENRSENLQAQGGKAA